MKKGVAGVDIYWVVDHGSSREYHILDLFQIILLSVMPDWLLNQKLGCATNHIVRRIYSQLVSNEVRQSHPIKLVEVSPMSFILLFILLINRKSIFVQGNIGAHFIQN